jgi:hypothetical protein
MASPGMNPRRKSMERLANLKNSPTIGRLAVINHAMSTASALKLPPLTNFTPANLWPWIINYLKYALTPRYRFQDYTGRPDDGLYSISSTAPAIFAIAGDWGTGTDEAATIAGNIASAATDFTIHLGDVYYVGDVQEIEENCLGQSSSAYDGVLWPIGSKGSFALNGNHEMYANGKPYFTLFLPKLGMKGGLVAGQGASFFCLDFPQWRIIGIDTGYNSVGLPIIGAIPGLGADCHLEKKLIEWLRTVVMPGSTRKATLLLSHHQYFTAFSDKAYTKPAEQLREFFGDQPVVWLWGHEHRLALYNLNTVKSGITTYGRCVGHAGMPVETGTPDVSKAPLLRYDARTHKLNDGTVVGENGYVLATLNGAQLSLEYLDIGNTLLWKEVFTAGPNGSLTYNVAADPGILAAQ